MMANVTLDSQTFFTFPVAADRKSTSPNLWAQDGDPSVASSRGAKSLQHYTRDPQLGAGGASQNDAILISSDDESDYDDLDDGKSDISFPPIGEFLRAAGRKEVEPGNVAGIDKSFSPTVGAGGNSDAVESSVTEGANQDDEVASSQQQQKRDMQHSPAPSSASALTRPSSASPTPLQVEHDRPIPAGSASSEAELASAPEDTTCGKLDLGISRASLPGFKAQHMPNPSRLSGPSPPRLEEGTDREGTPRRDLAGVSHSDDETGQPLAKPESGQRRNAIGHGVFRSLRNSTVDPKDKDKAAQQSNGQDGRRRHIYRRRRNNREDEDVYHPPRASERDSDEEDDDIRQPQRKRLKTNSPAQSSLRTSTGPRTRSIGGTSASQRVQTSAAGRKRSSRRSIPSPPSSQGSGDEEGSIQVPMAKFEEWPLRNAVLKRVLMNSQATFQLEFTWDVCTSDIREDSALGSRQYKLPPKRRHSAKHQANKNPLSSQREDRSLPEINDQKEWEVQDILASRIYYRKLQYRVKWVSWDDDDQEWYNASGFKGSPLLLGKYHSSHPEMPGPPVRLEQWLRAYESGAEAPDHPDDNKPVMGPRARLRMAAPR